MWASVRRKFISGGAPPLTSLFGRGSSNLPNIGSDGYLGFPVGSKPVKEAISIFQMDPPVSMLSGSFSSAIGQPLNERNVRKHVATRLPFVDAFLLQMNKKKDLLSNKKIWSRSSVILPDFAGYTVRIYNGRTFVHSKITEAKVDHKFSEFAYTRKQKLLRTSATTVKKKGKK